MNIEKLDRKIQRDMILSTIENQEKDYTMNEYIRQIMELDEQSAKTQNNLNATAETYSDFSAGVKNGSAPDIQFHLIPGTVGANGEKGPDTLFWVINDPLLGIVEKGRDEDKVITKDIEARMKKKVIGAYMTRRPALIKERREDLERKIQNLRGKDKTIKKDKASAGSRKENYEDYKKSNAERYAAGQDKKITIMREALRKQYGKRKKSLTNNERCI